MNNDNKLVIGKTPRGFKIIKFLDDYGCECSIQKSSAANEDKIWFGVNDPDPKIMASKTPEGGTGWVTYPIPEDVFLNTRMHLTREQVAQLIPVLELFVKTGEITTGIIL